MYISPNTAAKIFNEIGEVIEKNVDSHCHRGIYEGISWSVSIATDTCYYAVEKKGKASDTSTMGAQEY